MKRFWKATLAAVSTSAILFMAIGFLVPVLPAQVSNRSVDITVTGPYGRSVAGLDRSHFTVTEAGVQRTITAFSELRDEEPTGVVHYKLEFESTGQGTKVDIVLNPPRGVPPLTVRWK